MKTALTILILLALPHTALSKNNTSDFWKCLNRKGGRWVIGTAPYACSSSPFISDNLVRNKFSPYIFNEKKSSSTERVRYTTELAHLVKKSAEYYLLKRKPSASSSELKYWSRAVQTISYHESFLSHFRKGTDSRVRMMRGDFGHGHGLMQVDDRWHFAAVNRGEAANLTTNFFYALDIYYQAWQAAAKKSCVGSSLYNRARAAYSGYNGGLKSLCRFTNPSHRWAHNDRHFKEKFDGQQWKRYISSKITPSKVNVACLANNQSSCDGSSPSPQPAPPAAGPVKVEPHTDFINKFENKYCAYKQNQYFCVTRTEDRGCLSQHYKIRNAVRNVNSEYKVSIVDTETLCPAESNSNVFKVGQNIKILKNINLRRTAGGKFIKTLKRNRVYQILDVYLANMDEGARYYKVQDRNNTGYIYAGDNSSALEWTGLTSQSATPLLPYTGARIRIKMASGINLRSTPGGRRLTAVPYNTELKVLSTRKIRSSLYLKVSYRGRTGYIYSGQILSKNTVSRWVSLVK